MPKPAVLIAAASGRALAASARRAGYAPLVVDYFADQDTIASAQAHVRLASGLDRGMHAPEVIAALQTLSEQHAACGVVWGSGFEDRPSLLRDIAQRWTLIGNAPGCCRARQAPDAAREAVPELRYSLSRNPDGSPRRRDWMADQAHRWRRRNAHSRRRCGSYLSPQAGRGKARSRLVLLPAPCRWRTHLRARPCRRQSRINPRLQHAMVEPQHRTSISLWRRGAAGAARARRR